MEVVQSEAPALVYCFERGKGERERKWKSKDRKGEAEGRRGCHVTLSTHLYIIHSRVAISWRYGWVSVSAEICT
jgi:hypothetical protein